MEWGGGRVPPAIIAIVYDLGVYYPRGAMGELLVNGCIDALSGALLQRNW